mmetsp:Transcript_14184/g.21296  ORF Transcript_14184/g.21296 Transcript_14184/m.21296 type:complete len:561 (+) Transcript_14184:117-1799(+)
MLSPIRQNDQPGGLKEASESSTDSMLTSMVKKNEDHQFVDLLSEFGCCGKTLITGCFAIGYFASFFVCPITGPFALSFGIKSMIRLLFYQNKWIELLENFQDKNSIEVEGKIVEVSKTSDPITDFITYSVGIEYNGSSDECIQKIFDTQSNPSNKELYDFANSNGGDDEKLLSIAIMLVPGEPYSGTPALLIKRKLADYTLWKNVIHPVLIFLCLYAYFAGAWYFAALVDERFGYYERYAYYFHLVMGIACSSPLLMFPYVYFYDKKVYSQRLSGLATDPAKLETESDTIRKLWNYLGPTFPRKMYALLFPPGLFIMLVEGLIYGGLGGWLFLWAFAQMRNKITDRKRELLQSLMNSGFFVTGSIISRRVSGKNNSHFIKYRYEAPTGDVVEREIASNQGGPLLDIRVLDGFPKSGMPIKEIEEALSSNRCAAWIGLPLAMIAGLIFYVCLYWVLFMMDSKPTVYDVFNYAVEHVIPLVLVYPQLSVLTNVWYRRYVHDFLNAGIIVVPSPGSLEPNGLTSDLPNRRNQRHKNRGRKSEYSVTVSALSESTIATELKELV